MAFIRLKNKQHRFVSAEQGITIWQIMNGEINGTAAQRKFVSFIDRVYLNKENAPESYMTKYHPAHIQTVGRLPYAD